MKRKALATPAYRSSGFSPRRFFLLVLIAWFLTSITLLLFFKNGVSPNLLLILEPAFRAADQIPVMAYHLTLLPADVAPGRIQFLRLAYIKTASFLPLACIASAIYIHFCADRFGPVRVTMGAGRSLLAAGIILLTFFAMIIGIPDDAGPSWTKLFSVYDMHEKPSVLLVLDVFSFCFYAAFMAIVGRLWLRTLQNSR